MHKDFDELTFPENGPRWSLKGSFRGADVTVNTGYSATVDAWAYHVYVTLPSGEHCRLTEGSTFTANTKDDARTQGLEMASVFIRRKEGGFQKIVR